MRFYQILKIVIGIADNIKIEEKIWKKFRIDKKVCDLQVISLKDMEPKTICYGIESYIIESQINKIHKLGKDVMFSSSDWKKICIAIVEQPNNLQSFLLQGFYAHAIRRKAFQLHSSLVEYRGAGILFLGHSGVGKTTQAELWNYYRSAKIINGDMVYVQEIENSKKKKFLGWGTPWHGSSPYCLNENVPIKALVVLRQASKNDIRRLVGFEKVTKVTNHVIYPRWLENGMELCLDVLDHLLNAVPVYELSCRPDEEAVEITEKAVFGD